MTDKTIKDQKKAPRGTPDLQQLGQSVLTWIFGQPQPAYVPVRVEQDKRRGRQQR